MIQAKDYERLSHELSDCLRDRFPDVEVRIAENVHYKGVNVIVTSHKFSGLLAEQRYHHVVRAIPKDLYEKYFQQGVVWFELSPGETGKDLMKMARSTDLVGPEETTIRRLLDQAKFFKIVSDYFEEEDEDPSGVTFEATRRVLTKAGLAPAQLERCCLYLILKGAYCDAHVVNDLAPKVLAESAA